MKNKMKTLMHMQKKSSLRASMAMLAAMAASGSLFAAPHNIAFRRAVYQSSAADCTHAGHLAADGKVTEGPLQLLLVKSEFPDKSPGAETPNKAIDGIKDTKWLVFKSKCWLEVKLPAPARATSYAIMSANDEPKRDPQKWRVLGSNDGATFEEVAAGENPGFANRHERKSWQIDKPGTYRFYRLAIDANGGLPETQLAEFDLLDDAGTSIIRKLSTSSQSRWISKSGANEWLKVDLGAPSRVDSVSVKWAKGGEADSSHVELSADGKTWTRGTSGKDVRFVKLVCEKAKGDVFGVDEIEVMGDNALKVAETGWHLAPAPYGKFEEGMLSKTRPTGWLGEACRVQAEGMTGHPEAMSYPYDTCLWDGEIPRRGKHDWGWWRFEQTAYYVDGLLRLGYALGDEAFIKKGEANVDYTLDHAAPDGYLGHKSLSNSLKINRWPFAVFFRAMQAKYDATGDERIPAALEKYFLLYDAGCIAIGRHVINVEGMLWTYARTGNQALLDLAEKAWNLRKPKSKRDVWGELTPANCISDDPIYMHGVSYSEELKVPMLLAAYTGKKEYLDQALNAERKFVRDDMLPDGCPETTEHTRGNSVYLGHETCDVADYTWSIGYYLETTGDASFADKIERCIFNAGFGCVDETFHSLQYFSNPNQFIATHDSNHNPHYYGSTWMQYRPMHETDCCAGNVHRILPNYVARMWMKDKKGEAVAALYGPSEVDYGWAKIKEETNYPFDGKIKFRFSVKKPGEHSFTYRVPGWCKKGASVKAGGKSVAAAEPGKFATITRKFKDGDVIELDFPMEAVFEVQGPRFEFDNNTPTKEYLKYPGRKFANASQGTVVTRGPLLFAYAIPFEKTEDTAERKNMSGKKSGNPDFKCWDMRPTAPFNYALAGHKAELVQGIGNSGKGIVGGKCDGFYKNPAQVKLRVPVKRIKWELKENRFTPDIPEKPEVLDGSEETIELVPYGATTLRLTVFPDLTAK